MIACSSSIQPANAHIKNENSYTIKLLETSKFNRSRKKIKEEQEREALKLAIKKILNDPDAGKKLKGEFRDLRSFRYTVKGQARRLIYKLETNKITLFSFGPREGIYK